MRTLSVVFRVLPFVLFLGGNAAAQSGNATVSGIVTDATSALIPGVTIKATNTQTAVVTSTVSKARGSFG